VLLATAVSTALALLPPPQQVQVADTAPASRSVGQPNAGRLVRGVPFPPVGDTFVTWDPVLHRSPDRVWRRYATVRTIRRTLGVIHAYAKAHPGAARVLVGDLSRPNGGPFGREYGGLGHASHQNGTDVDVYYPRKDGLETAPRRPSQVDQRLAQDLVNRFVRAGAVYVFVGPRLSLKGPRRTVQKLIYHDDHLHVRWRP
jgi:murein endopeptidase